jgi:hypothetical protein
VLSRSERDGLNECDSIKPFPLFGRVEVMSNQMHAITEYSRERYEYHAVE